MKLYTVLVLLILFRAYNAGKQGVAVKGGLLCNGKPYPNAKIQIFDVDRLPGDSDELLDQNISGSMGRFLLDGTTNEVTNIEPEIRIYHKCNFDGAKTCQKKYVRPIPSEYIYGIESERRFYDFRQIELAVLTKHDKGEICD
ncbi:unnamed protein product [Bursaphelenchus okinawaensis]|uniref:Uncharacterized protein n=1 Tax=Bursaphelenchus okinawaensis TaxID=465554 RepID=A0A811L3B2_9BILA|nr:unnamed protein product [Bursaphelenchus okinawaensis]CAG9116558.1 unnamed protein product [Bursaphelenchus okinawaensis]